MRVRAWAQAAVGFQQRPLTRHFPQSFHAVPRRRGVNSARIQKCRGQIDVVGATGLERATPCSRTSLRVTPYSD
jgi:hypothetical protein